MIWRLGRVGTERWRRQSALRIGCALLRRHDDGTPAREAARQALQLARDERVDALGERCDALTQIFRAQRATQG